MGQLRRLVDDLIAAIFLSKSIIFLAQGTPSTDTRLTHAQD